MSFVLTAKQKEAQKLCSGDATHILLDGGSRSGKTALHVRNIVMRALKAPRSRHAILRYRFNHVKASIIMDTFPKVMELAYPKVKYRLDRTDWFTELGEGSEIWFGGLDDKERTEKILGNEYVTLMFNEASQIPWMSREMAMTRLAQKVMQKIEGKPETIMKPRALYDANPPNKAHWLYRLFTEKVHPDTRVPLPDPQNYVRLQMNPRDNQANISPEYMKTLEALSPRLRMRFLDGLYADATPNALFSYETIDLWRHSESEELPDMVRVVVAVDPSGSGDEDNAHNDEIGILVVGLGTNGKAYVLEDCSVKAGPGTWGKVSTGAYERHEASVIVGEKNFGGDMVRFTIQTARPGTPYKHVTASRGKVARAEPFSSLYEAGKIRHVGRFPELEDELCAFSTLGYLGTGSPNRADALIWGLAELFPGLVKKEKDEKPREIEDFGLPAGMMTPFGWGAGAWMR